MSSQENKQNLLLLVRDTVCNGHYANTTIIANYVVSDDEVLPAKANGGAEIPETLELDGGSRQQASATCGVGCSCKTMPESCRSFQRYMHFCITATLCPIPTNAGVEGTLATVWLWRKATHASTASGSFSTWSTTRQDSDSGI